MIQVFDNIDFFFDNLTEHQASILFLFLFLCLFVAFKAFKKFKHDED